MADRTKHFWETNYRQSIAQMIGICYRYTHNRQIAEDLAHDAFLLAIEKSASFENKGHFNAWLRRIVVNVALQYLRDQKRHKVYEEKMARQTELIENEAEKQGCGDQDFIRVELLEAIRMLPEHHRLVFNLYVMDQFTHAQIADELGISEGTSKSHLARARKKIKEFLNHQFKEKKQRKPAFLFFVLPFKLWGVDRFFTQRFNDFELPAQQSFSVDGFDLIEAAITHAKSSVFTSAIYVKTGLAVLGLAFGSIFFNQAIQAPATSQGFIVPTESSPSTIRKNGKSQSGTLYASSITYTSTVGQNPHNVLVVDGKYIKIDFKSQKFTGNGSFVFLDHIDYLQIDGVPVKLKETIKLKDKKYDLIELDEKQSTKKYGAQVKKAIEITLAE